MAGVNPMLLKLAQTKVWKQASREKTAVVPPGGDPAAAGAPPMPPPGGAPPGGAPPPGGDPAAMGAPPMDPMAMASMGMSAPGMPPPGMGQPAGPAGPAAPQKIKPEQWMQMLDFRLYNLQQQITALLNAMNIQVPAGALITPPGMPAAPTPESAMPGGPQDPSQQAWAPAGGGGGAAGGASAISPVEPIQGASPDLAAGGGAKAASYIGEPFPSSGQPAPRGHSVQTQVSALAAVLRSKTSQAA